MSPVALQTENKEHYLEDFETFSHLYGNNFRTLRKQSMDSFMAVGFPKTKEESYRYLNLSPVTSNRFVTANPSLKSSVTREEIASLKVAGPEALVLVFINGMFYRHLSDLKDAERDIFIGIVPDENDERYFGQAVEIASHSFNALNNAFFNDVACIRIPEEIKTKRPVHLLHLTDAIVEKVISYPRNLIIAEKNSKSQIIATYHSLAGNQISCCNAVTEIFLEEGASVEFDVKQHENEQALHFSHVYAVQKKNSLFDISTVTLGGSLVRNDLTIRLTETNCAAHLYGLTLAGNRQVVDHHTVVDHQSPDCNSNQLYKTLLDDDAQGVFNGKIFVRKDAQKTNAYQSSKNVLLSNRASMNAKPQLEIFADDVRCSHGATTGELDEDALFYFRARGIGEQDAKALLNFAFASDVIEKINNEYLRKDLLLLLSEKLHSQIEFDLN